MRLLSLFLLATAAFAQVPTDTLTVKRWERDTPRKKFLRENPGAVEVKRLPDAVHFKLPPPDTPPDPFNPPATPRPTHAAIFGRGIAHVDAISGEILPTEQQIWEIEGGGYRATGGPVTVRLVDGPGNSSVIEVYGQSGRAFKLNSNRATYLGENRFTFDWESLTWTVELTPFGWDLSSSPIAAARGVRTYQAPYIQSLLSLSVDGATGDLVGDSGERLSRAQMIGADRLARPCSAWSLTTKVMSFVCDDSTLPPEAFPYKIDPTYSAVASGTVRQDCYQIFIEPYGHPGVLLGCDQSYFGAQDGIWPLGFGVWGRYDNASWFRFDTSSIPANAVVTGGTWRILGGQGGTMFDNVTLPVYWWNYAAKWPVAITDRLTNPSLQWQAGSRGPTGADWPNWVYLDFPLTTNLDRVTKGPGAYTAIKMGGDGATGTGSNIQDYYGPWGYGTRHSNAPLLTLTYNLPPSNVSATPANGSILANVWTTFTAVYRDSDGVADLNELRLLLAYGVNGTNACHPMYRKGTNAFHILNDAGSNWGTGHAPGSAVTLSNSQCDFDVQNSSVSCSGTDCTVNWRVRFKPTFTYGGVTKRTYTHAYDMAYGESGWSDWGAWTLIAGGPKLIVVSE